MKGVLFAESDDSEKKKNIEIQGLFTNSHKSLVTCMCYNYCIIIKSDWSFVVIIVNSSVHVQVFTVSILFTQNFT